MNEPTKQAATDRISAHADRPATPEEAAAAEAARRDVDVASVGEHETEMNRLGANVQGEGQIEPGQR